MLPKVIHKTAEAAAELIGKKVSEKIVKPKPLPDEKLRNVEEIVMPSIKRQEILRES